ncbi:UPF0149 family protein [Opacimonas viscosa]|uniref:UPF0149 family protein n=1 Tax=Opacimonas viscosa TaxID=2961944 RepID=A0AA41X1W6_9ALTE|nr:UPF0149 family protein [Opacimonas viscosa]MCP3428478.1 UPF0149 family protein [Opacimonas viscosa]
MSQQFQTLTDLLAKHDILIDGAELHGLICGMLSGGMPVDNREWFAVLADISNNGVDYPQEVLNAVDDLFSTTVKEYAENDFALNMLIPEMDAPINEQGQGLIHWVQGFMTGIGLRQTSFADCSEEVQEGIQDFAEIMRMDAPMDDDEETESQLTEVIEYVRITAMLCFNEFQPAQAATKIHVEETTGSATVDSDKPTLH